LESRLARLLEHARVLRKVWLSPEVSPVGEMIALTQGLQRRALAAVNLFFHSSVLVPGLTPCVRTADDQRRFLADLRAYFAFSARSGIESMVLSEAPGAVPRLAPVPQGPADLLGSPAAQATP
jgi:hypothetical protein